MLGAWAGRVCVSVGRLVRRKVEDGGLEHGLCKLQRDGHMEAFVPKHLVQWAGGGEETVFYFVIAAITNYYGLSFFLSRFLFIFRGEKRETERERNLM